MGFVIHWNESALGLHVFPIPIPPPTSRSTRNLWVFPVHQVRALVSCIPPGLVICVTLDNTHVSMLFSWNIPPSPSPTFKESVSTYFPTNSVGGFPSLHTLSNIYYLWIFSWYSHFDWLEVISHCSFDLYFSNN